MNTPLRFLFEATGQIVRFTDNADPAPRSQCGGREFDPHSANKIQGQTLLWPFSLLPATQDPMLRRYFKRVRHSSGK